MKFFRQTKETKRKLSFFLALAMVISLLPVTPVAKAATTTANSSDSKVKVNCDADNLSIASNGVTLSPVTGTTTTQSAIITLTAEREITDNATALTNNLIVSVATGTALDDIQTENAVTTKAAIEINETDKKSVTVTVTDIAKADNIYTLITISGSVTLKPVEIQKYTVSIDKTSLDSGINLEVSGVGEDNKVEANKTVTLTISSKDNNAAIDTPPTLTVNDENVDWKGSSATITITRDTIIIVKGGTVKPIASNEIKPATPAPDVTNQTGIKDVSIESPDNTNIKEVTKNLVTGAQKDAEDKNNITITNEKGETVFVTNELQKQIQEALKNPATRMETSLKVNVASSSAVTEAKELVNKATDKDIVTTDISDEKQKNALGNDIKATVSKMLNESDVVALDITLTGSFKLDGATSAAITISEVKGGIKVTMDVPTKYTENGKAKTTGYYYAIRIHDGKVSILPCKLNGEKISFVSDRFSTYVISYIEGSSDNNNNNNNSGGNNNGYIPGPGTTSSSAPSANPSVTPSTNPSGAPSANPSGAPSANPSGAPSANPSSAPSANPSSAPSANPTNSPANPTKKPSTVKVGKKATISGSQYKVTAVKGTRTVQFTKGKKNAKKIVIPSTVKVSGKSYKVTTIAKNALKGNKKLTKLTIGANVTKIGVNAFKGCSKLKSIIVKTKKLTKSKVGKNAFKGINSKATIKVPKAKVKAYKKIVQAKGAGKGVKVKK